MKTFKKYLTLSEDISSGLMEAGITRDIDYPEGTQVVVKSGKVKTLQTKLDKVNSKIQITAEKILTKQSGPFENVPTVELGAGKDFVYLQAGKKVFKVTGSAGGISGYFNHYKMQDGINWNTPTMETAACIGLYLDGELMLADIGTKGVTPTKKNIDKWKKKIKSVLGNGQDWDNRGIESIQPHLDSISVMDMNVLACLASGMTTFKNGVVSFGSINLIHNKIVDYYNAEIDNSKIEKQGSKANTADCIVSNSSLQDTLKAVETGKPKFDKKTGMITIGKVKYFQVSLKKKKGGAQLGKITSAILTRYDISADTLFNTVMGEEIELTEGLLDFIKKAGAKVLDLAQRVLGYLRDAWSKLRKALTSESSYKNQSNKDHKIFEKITGVNLYECFEYEHGLMLNEEVVTEAKKLKISDKLRGLNQSDKKKLRDLILTRLGTTQKIFDNTDSLAFKHTKAITKPPKTADDLFKLFANYVSIQVYNDLIGNGEYTNNRMKKEIISLQKEMYFGKTMLPVWKVYGAKKVGDTSTYSFLHSGQEFIDAKTEKLKGKKIRLVGFRANSQGMYYTITSSFILGIDDDGNPKYNEVRTGTNSLGSFSFVFEGANEHDEVKFNKTYL
jgi:hypothetical protein